MANFGPLTAEICWRVWGTPANFNGFRILPSLLQRCRSPEANQTLHDIWSVEERRNRADLIELFKMVRGISTVPLRSFFKLADGSSTRGHRWKLVKEHSRCDARLYFFSVRVLNRWNSLPQSAVQVQSVNCFKNQLAKIIINKMDFLWTTSPLNPLDAEQSHWEWMCRDMHRFNMGAAAPGEIPGEILISFQTWFYVKIKH